MHREMKAIPLCWDILRQQTVRARRPAVPTTPVIVSWAQVDRLPWLLLTPSMDPTLKLLPDLLSACILDFLPHLLSLSFLLLRRCSIFRALTFQEPTTASTATAMRDPLLRIRKASRIGYMATPQDNNSNNSSSSTEASKVFHPFKAPTSVRANNNSDTEAPPVSLEQLPFQSQRQHQQQVQMEMQQYPPMGLQDPRDTPTSPHLPLPSPFSPAVQAAHTLLNFHNATPPPH